MTQDINKIDQMKQAQETEQTNKSDIKRELQKIEQFNQADKKIQDNIYQASVSEAKHLDAIKSESAKIQPAQRDQGVRVLAGLAKDLAKMGVADLSPKTLSKSAVSRIDDEMQKILDRTSTREDKYSTTGQLTSESIKRTHNKKEEKKNNREDDAKRLINSPDVKDAVHEYAGAYAQYAVVASPDAKDRLDNAQLKLRKKGFSESDITSLERAVKRSFRTNIVSEVQSSFIQHMFSSKDTFDYVVSAKNLGDSYKTATQSAPEIMGDLQTAKREIRQMTDSAKVELRDFVRDAAESMLMARHLHSIDNRAEMKKLIELGKQVGFDFVRFQKVWEEKKFDLGLFVLEVRNEGRVENPADISIGEIGAEGVGDRHGYEMTKDEEREFLINQLRAEMMKRALTGDPFAVFNFVPKIRTLQNGLIKLGLVTDDFQKIEKEAKVLARYRTLELLREAFVERSTYYELSGPAFDVLNNKLKGLIANLENLGMHLSGEQLDMIRDQANRLMHDHSIIELKSALALLDSRENTAVEQKVPLMIKLIERLRQESGFQHGLGEDIVGILAKHEDIMNGIKEHA